MKAFLGTGLLGSGFALAALEKGEEVRVWNRTAAKAVRLEEHGAKAFTSPAEAVQGADFIHLTLKDDASVDEVLANAAPELKEGAVIIDHTTTSVDGAIKRTESWKKQGFTYLHAPVMMGPKNARESTGFMLVSGDQELINSVLPQLSGMTGKVMNFGPQNGKAAAMKLAGNLFLIALNGSIGDMVTFAGATQIAMDDLITFFSEWNPGVAVTGRLKKLEEGDFTNPSWELRMARKDAGLMINEAEQANLDIPVINSIVQKMDRLIEKGLGENDWTIIAEKPVVNLR